MRRAFTLIEMTVALAVVVLMVVFGGFVFKSGIGAQRAGNAQAEVMLKLRTITEQLNSDFRGLRKHAPMMIWFEVDPNSGRRFDQIMFFANGDFQSTQPYLVGVPDVTGAPIASNVARISYGQANMADYSVVPGFPITSPYPDVNCLARRQHVLSYGYGSVWPLIDTWQNLQGSFDDTYNYNDTYEHDAIALAFWQMISRDPAYNGVLANVCALPAYRPRIDLEGSIKGGLQMLLSENISGFAVQWGYAVETAGVAANQLDYVWWPRTVVDAYGNVNIADFMAMPAVSVGPNYGFGIFCNLPLTAMPAVSGWYFADAVAGPLPPPSVTLLSIVRLNALKFTFTIEDSRGVLEPQTFTHIVYLSESE
jgi:prepilin-type N-terminal cleavage/methylation domain-containing protein